MTILFKPSQSFLHVIFFQTLSIFFARDFSPKPSQSFRLIVIRAGTGIQKWLFFWVK